MATFEFDTTGTVNVTNGSVEVTGVDTNWVANYPGLMLNIDGLEFPVKSVNSRHNMTLVHPYSGSTATGKAYTIVPVHPNALNTQKSVNQMIEAINDLIASGGIGGGGSGSGGPGISSAVVNSAGHLIITLSDGRKIDAGLVKGEDGQDGQDGVGGGGGVAIQSVVDLTQFAGQPAGGKGVYMIIPVADGDPGLTLTQQAEVIIPEGSTNAGIGIWARTTVSGMAIVLGLTNVPLPQPGGGDEDIDLSGSATFYAPFNAITPLGLTTNGSDAPLTLTIGSGLNIKRKHDTPIVVPSSAKWVTGGAGSPYPVTGDAVSSTATLSKAGDGLTEFRNGHLVLHQHAYLRTPALAFEFPNKSDIQVTQTPPSVKLVFKGIIPAGVGRSVVLGELRDWSAGLAAHRLHWNGSIEFSFGRDGGLGGAVQSDQGSALSGANHLIETEWVDDPNGPGGTVTFYVDGQQYGAPKPTEGKPRISAAADLQVNASVGNTNDSIDDLEIEYIGIGVGNAAFDTSYSTIPSGPITVADLENLVIDASGVTTQQPERVLSYTANGNQKFDLTIVVGEMVLPAGRPYKAVLEDWSTGVGVPHPNELIMTKPAAQNCRFEDAILFGAQGSWTEVLPQGAVPIIDGIRYGCEGIRQGTYVMFQFVYSLDQPSEPFGDPSGLDTYMRPHKWLIYDNEGTLLHRVEKPNGEPLNAASTKPIWEGSYDGRSVPIITANNRWYPHGTARCSVVYRNGKPPAYDQQFIYDHLPVYDQRVPFASATGFSVNGFDLRVFAGGAGGDGQCNGFANWKVMPWRPLEQTYDSIKSYAANTLDPYKSLYTDVSVTPNAALHLKYTPFNTMGRCPIVGPGGTRDDRQIIAEPVARYMRDVTKVRPHDHTPLADIALDYLTGYASDPFNAVVNGKMTPLFKGNPLRNITMRNHYYGPGEATTPEDQAWYAQVGRLSEWTTTRNPLRCNVPSSGKTADRPYFGGFEIDNLHAHQFPHWGSLLFQSPEFAMFGINFSDQSRLYGRSILESMYSPDKFALREAAWPFLHAALLWKTASSNSTRLYNRQEVLDWVVFDFETFYDQWYASDPGFLNPPTNVMRGGNVDQNLAILAAAGKFGPCGFDSSGDLMVSEFQAGYWLSALHAAHKLGFLDAIRAASDKAKAVVNWLIVVHRKRVVGRINDGMLIDTPGGYVLRFWTGSQIVAAGGNVADLPRNFTEVAAALENAPSWDTYYDGDKVALRDGQAMDATLAAPALLKDMGLSGADLDQAVATAEGYFQEKLRSETAKGYASAGSEWFKYHQTTNNRPYKP